MSKTKKKPILTSSELYERIRAKWDEPEWVVLREVRSCTGYGRAERSADAMALSTYPSRGLQLLGFEVKSSRSDVIRELKDPDKAAEIQRRCDGWYLVLGREDLIEDGELPPTWGLVVPYRTGLKIKVKAPIVEPEPWPRDFVTSLVRSAHRQQPAAAEIDKAVSAVRESERAFAVAEGRRALERFNTLKDAVTAFEEVSGVRINGYSAVEEGKNYQKFRAMGLERLLRFAAATAGRFEQAATELRAIGANPS